MKASEKVIAKIRKMLEMAARSTNNENEAANAATKAQELLIEYNLSREQVLAEDDEEAEAVAWDSETVTPNWQGQWPAALNNAIAAAYFCGCMRHKKRLETIHIFVGKPHDILVAKLMSAYLFSTVHKLALQHIREHGITNAAEKNRYRRAFNIACAFRLIDRLEARTAQAQAGQLALPGAAKVPALYNAAAAAAQQFMEGKTKAVAVIQKPGHVGAVLDGLKAGDEIGLDPQVAGRADSPRLAGR